MGKTKDANHQELMEVINSFDFGGELEEVGIFGNGHINETYCAVFSTEAGQKRYILQKMNKQIFKDPVGLMENISGVTSWLKKKILENGGDAERETLNIVNDRAGAPYLVDKEGEYWRAYHFVEDAYALEEVKDPQDFYQSAEAFGNFQRMLADFPADTLTETIAGFHDTKARFAAFEKAVEEDVCGRAAGVQQEIRFIKDRYDVACVLGDLLEAGELPLRVTHNDTKSNNVLMDNTTGKGLCVIDLDTVMPGLAVNDFGDSIRFGASTGAEDEKDLSRISCDMELYDIYAKGFVEGCGGALTDMEIECLPIGAKVMTYECGMRFLTDYLSGDTYFKVDYPTHNLDRTRTQLKLVWDMEQKWEQMQEIARKYKNK